MDKKLEITETGQEIPGVEGGALATLARFDAVKAICLFGSAARGEEVPDSDLDVLVLVDDAIGSQSLRAEARAIRAAVDRSTQVCMLSEGRLRASFSERTVFAAHLAREGRVMTDRDGVLTGLLEDYPRDAPVQESAVRLVTELDVYSDLTWCGGHYLFCLADLYAWSRSGAMLALARDARFEFDRDKVFDALGDRYPGLASAATITKRLRPFWEKVNRPQAQALPFPPDGADEEALLARDACRAIVEKGL